MLCRGEIFFSDPPTLFLDQTPPSKLAENLLSKQTLQAALPGSHLLSPAPQVLLGDNLVLTSEEPKDIYDTEMPIKVGQTVKRGLATLAG